jgi:hypothetical protein
MPRCESCNKFVSLDEQEPEVQGVDLQETTVSASVRIANACADCGTDLREATLDMECDISEDWDEHLREVALKCKSCDGEVKPAHYPEGEDGPLCEDCAGEHDHEVCEKNAPEAPEEHELEDPEETNSERVQRTEGKGRGAKTFYGAKVEFTIKCKCGWEHQGELQDDIQASAMDEL